MTFHILLGIIKSHLNFRQLLKLQFALYRQGTLQLPVVQGHLIITKL